MRHPCSCGLVSLRVGVLVIAAIEIVHDVLILGFSAWNVIETSYMYELKDQDRPALEVVAVVVRVILSSIDLLFSVMLLHGILKENIKQILAWWWWSTILVVLMMVKLMWIVIYETKNDRFIGVPFIVISCIMAIIILFLMVVRSYVKYLRRKKLLPSILLDEDDEEDV